MDKCMNCKHCLIDRSEPCECYKQDVMTEEELEKYWTNAEDNCPYYEDEVL